MSRDGSDSLESKTLACASGQQKPCVTVIMANYNGERFLSSAIESVQNQTLADLELIICDDASTDGSMQIISSYASGDPRIKLVRNSSNTGLASARNRALDIASGTWIAVMHSDDIMHPTRLKTLVGAATRDGAAIAADDLIVFYQDGTKSSHGLLSGIHASVPFWVELADLLRSSTKGDGLGYLKPIIRADLLRANGVRYDETLNIGEDYGFVLRSLMAGLKYRVYPKQLYFHRKHSSSNPHGSSSKPAWTLLEAHRRLSAKLGHGSREARSAFKARTKSIETVLAFNAVIDALKSPNFQRAALHILRRPRLLVLMREPASARLARFCARLRSPIQIGTQLFGRAAQ